MVALSTLIAGAITYLGLVNTVDAFWRLRCAGIVAMAQIDPIVSHGEVSGHVHSVKGASGFSDTATAASLVNSNCTSCEVAQDHSAYWTPALYFMNTAGQTTAVPEVAGHLTYYKYTPCYVNGVLTNPSAMPNGLTMISGDSSQRNFTYPIPDPPMPWYGNDATQAALRQKAIGFNCLNYAATPEPSLYRHFMPTKSYLDANCLDGLRLELLFPQCWNGSLDSTDHKSHLAFPSSSINGGSCPPGFDHVINQIFYETIFDTTQFKDQDGEFVLSNGDPTGYGYHGDIIVAWEDGILDAATTQCGPDLNPSDAGFNGITSNCPVFDMVPVNDQAACKVAEANYPAPIVKADVMGPMAKLPGNNPIQSGPAYATRPAASGAPATPPPPAAAPPTLSYTAGVSGTNPAGAGGNIFLKATDSTTTTSSTLTSTTTTTTSTTVASASSSTTSSVAPPPTVAPAPTVAPNAPIVNPSNVMFSTVGTSMTTIGAIAYENVLVEEVVTVFVTGGDAAATGAAKARRHEHVGRHARHVHHARGAR